MGSRRRARFRLAVVATIVAGLGLAARADAYPSGEIFTTGTAGAGDTLLTAAPGTSPAIAPLTGSGYELAYHALDGGLDVDGPAHSGPLGLTMYPRTSPTITALPGGGYEAALEFQNGNVATAGSAGTTIYGLGMMLGTAPAIAASNRGGFDFAFEANTHQAWTGGTDGTDNSKIAMYPGDLWLYGSAATGPTGLPVQSGTDPSIAGLAEGGYEVAYAAPASAPTPAPVPFHTHVHDATGTIGSNGRSHGRRGTPLAVRVEWKWRGPRTLLRAIAITRARRHTRLALTCAGRRCPTPRTVRGRSGRLRAFERRLAGCVFHSGERIVLEARSPGRRPLRILIAIRRGRKPLMRLARATRPGKHGSGSGKHRSAPAGHRSVAAGRRSARDRR